MPLQTIWQTSDFDFKLPETLIAQYPAPTRQGSRLMVVSRERSHVCHDQFSQIATWLNPNDLLVFNNTQVIPARLYGHKDTGGHVEVLVERCLTAPQSVPPSTASHPLNTAEPSIHCKEIDDTQTFRKQPNLTQDALAHVKASHAPKIGSVLSLADGALTATVCGRDADLFVLRFILPLNTSTLFDALERYGRVPLPHYLMREAEPIDRERYQTVYAEVAGAVAAPTAGLHFDQTLLAALDAQGIQRTHITLHVGAGTFQPVRVEDITTHRMHAEWISLSSDTCDAIKTCQQRGGRVIAIGTTVVRCLESICHQYGSLRPYQGDINIFIYPGFKFKVIDGLLTNFHLPRSTLMMLVSAFGGHARLMAAYRAAIAAQYRFYSYGDAMLILK